MIESGVSYSVTEEGFDALEPSWSKLLKECPDRSIFLTPQWLKTWWRYFGQGQPLLLAVRREGQLVGVAPLMRAGNGLSLLGSPDVCDYSDIVAGREHQHEVCRAVLDYLQAREWDSLQLFSLPQDSTVLGCLVPLARERSLRVNIEQEEVCPRLELPATIDGYFSLLGRKDRHELRRKMRRLAAEQPEYSTVTDGDGVDDHMRQFCQIFQESQERKSAFLTARMSDFFLGAARAMAGIGALRLMFMKIGGRTASAVLGFDYEDTFYLYNSGYDKSYSHLSVGLLLKARSIEESIRAGKRVYDFLRGNEAYKYDLGGMDRPVFRGAVSRGPD